jgi:hypothetical protein
MLVVSEWKAPHTAVAARTHKSCSVKKKDIAEGE